MPSPAADISLPPLLGAAQPRVGDEEVGPRHGGEAPAGMKNQEKPHHKTLAPVGGSGVAVPFDDRCCPSSSTKGWALPCMCLMTACALTRVRVCRTGEGDVL